MWSKQGWRSKQGHERYSPKIMEINCKQVSRKYQKRNISIYLSIFLSIYLSIYLSIQGKVYYHNNYMTTVALGYTHEYIYIWIYIIYRYTCTYIYTHIFLYIYMQIYPVHHVPKCMSSYEAIGGLVINEMVHCLSLWLHIYILRSSYFCGIWALCVSRVTYNQFYIKEEPLLT